MSGQSTTIEINRQNLSETRVRHDDAPEASRLADGEVLLAVDEFAFTANNITYAVLGDSFRYWEFFPAEAGWGRVPVWGFADVVASTVDGVAEGARYYGYLPMSTHVVVEATRVEAHSFMDGAAHRRELSPIYNQYSLTSADPTYSRDAEPSISLFRPLFSTSVLLDDFLQVNDFFQANTIVISSASSKTSIGLAHQLSQRSVEVIGLTSESNRAFVEGLGYYTETRVYEEVEALEPGPTVLVDMAGNASIIRRVHEHLGEHLKHSCMVGATHWDRGRHGADTDLPGPKPEVFFAPGYAQTRLKEWGPSGFQQLVGAAWASFLPKTEQWVKVQRGSGAEAVTAAYRSVLTNQSTPATGHILSL